MPKHPITVLRFDGSLGRLAKEVCKLRFDRLALFFGLCAVELVRQANEDRRRRRVQLAAKLTAAAGCASGLQNAVESAFRISLPYMKREIHPTSLKRWERASEKTRWWLRGAR
jgi:hypothetical protein